MNLLLISIAVLLVLIALIAAVLKGKGASSSAGASADVYYLKQSLFSPAERSFFGVLESLDYEDITIVSKVRLADIFGLKKGLSRADRQRALNRISAKHLDFLLLRSSDGRPLLGIELDDASHQAARDRFVDSIGGSTGLPILHVVAKAAYDPKEVHGQIAAALAQTPSQTA